jgi:hypothetical protein
MKTTILRAIKPSPLTWLFLALLILVQFSFCARTLFNEPSQSTSQYGIGSPVEISYRDGSRQDVHIDWAVLIINFTLCYLLSAIAVALIERITGLHRPFFVYGGVALGIICLAFFISVAFSKYYWGYFFHRPAVLAELDDVTSVTSIVPVTTEQTPTGEHRFVANADFSITDQIAYARKDPYYNLDDRILVHLEEKQLLPEEMATSLDDTALYDLVLETGLLAEPQDGYMSAGFLRGVIVEARTMSGSQLVFLSATGQQVSNDHYPCYEMVFERHPQSGQMTLIRGQRFFFDVAGIEGAEWYAIWFVISLIGVIPALPTVTLIAGVRNTILSRRATVQVELSASTRENETISVDRKVSSGDDL